jgi:hypothetical protein
MKTTIRRLWRLEGICAVATGEKLREPLRAAVGYDSGSTRLESSKCHRRIDQSELLIEVVELDDRSDDVTHEALDQFVAAFPVEMASYVRRLGVPV